MIDCSAPPAELRQRLLAREQRGRDASEAGIQVMERQLEADQPPGDAELPCLMTAESGEGADTLWRRLRRLVDG